MNNIISRKTPTTKYDRIQQMGDYIQQTGFVSLNDLSKIYKVSINTVRRDLDELISMKMVEKVYGGVRAVRNSTEALLSFNERAIKNEDGKNYIGKVAASLVENNDNIFIDSGTTALTIIPHIVHIPNLTILTNNLQAIFMLMQYPQVRTICFGGQLNSKIASLSGEFCSIPNLRNFVIDKAFLAATGVSLDKGASNSTSGELLIKKQLVETSKRCILMADSSKFDKYALLSYAPLSAFTAVVTERLPSQPYLDFFKDNQINLLV